MASTDLGVQEGLDDFYSRLIRPKAFTPEELITNANQVAGHTGFYSVYKQPNICLKPFNVECVRGRREHLFYQIIEYFNRNPLTSTSDPDDDDDDDDEDNQLKSTAPGPEQVPTTGHRPLFYKDLALLTHPIPATNCNCILDKTLFESLSKFVAKFHHPKRLYDVPPSSTEHPFSQDINLRSYIESVYSPNLKCPCYGNDPILKSSCSTNYNKLDFFCLDDLTVHCRQPCIVDIKIGQITYDPMAIKEKVAEQSNKYQVLRQFGFRILGMKLVNEIKDKNYGKTLATTEQVQQALDGFFIPLPKPQYRYAVIEEVLKKLRCLYQWFDNKNINQLKFFSSSILIVYDCCTNSLQPAGDNYHFGDTDSDADDNVDEKIIANLIGSVRVKMIDFAHVFHVHDKQLDNDKDNNYMFGLKKLEQMFMLLLSRYDNRPQPCR